MKTKTLRIIKNDRQSLFDYKRLLNNLIKKIQKDLISHLLDDKTNVNDFKETNKSFMVNSTADELKVIFEQIGESLKLVTPFYSEKVKSIFAKLNSINRAKLSKALIDRIGIDLSKIIKSSPTNDLLTLAIDQNLSLIKSIVDKQLESVKNFVYQQLRSGEFDNTKIRDYLAKNFEITKRRANFIAKDQTHKFTSSLTEIRLKQLDILKYNWRNSQDIRVRGNPSGLYPNSRYNHWSREGKVYSFDKPPPDGNPGQPINCRCYAEPILPIEFDELLKDSDE